MRRYLFLFLLVFFCLGCVDSIIKPSATLIVASVDPVYVAWTKEGSGEEAVYTLPNVKISLKNESAIPANLSSTSVQYRTKLDEPISQLPSYSRKHEISLNANSTTDFEVALYYPEILTFVSLTKADIFPVKATVWLEAIDLNGNKIHVEANCLIYEPDLDVSYSPPSTTTTAPTPDPGDGGGTIVGRPTLKISSPNDGSAFSLGSLISFTGIASPPAPVDSIVWESDKNGVIGIGSLTIATNSLILGVHEISLKAEVSGEALSDEISITINP